MTVEEEGRCGRRVRAPMGVRLAQVAKAISGAFDQQLSAAGGSRPVWLVLMAVRRDPGASQQQLAQQVGVRAATLTHHLAAMEARGLVTRSREPRDRRNQSVRLLPEGERLFQSLRAAAEDFDRRLCAGLDDEELALVSTAMDQLERNVVSNDRAVGGS